MLSDPQERAWYDDHREAILRGGTGADDDGPTDGMNLMAFFSGTIFRGFGDDPGGFYASYGQIFHDIFDDGASVFENPDIVFRPFVSAKKIKRTRSCLLRIPGVSQCSAVQCNAAQCSAANATSIYFPQVSSSEDIIDDKC